MGAPTASPRLAPTLPSAALIAWALIGCTGNIGDPAAEAEPGSSGPGDFAGEDTGRAAPGPYPLRVLTADEYDRTVADLLGVTTRPSEAFAAEITGDTGFATVGQLTTQHLKNYMQASEALATEVVADLDEFLPCDASGDAERECLDTFVRQFGLRAYRRPLRPEEAEEYLAFYDQLRTDGLGLSDTVRVLVQAFLQSPYFLYHWEFADPAADAAPDPAVGAIPLDSWALASRLSYFLWRTMPDDALFAAAAADELTSAAGVEREARRMLDDPRAEHVVDDFFAQLLHFDDVLETPKSEDLYPELDEGLRRAMREEVRALVLDVLLEGDGSLATLLTTNRTFANEALASVYGLEGVQGPELRPVQVDSEVRAGLLTTPAFLAVSSDAVEGNPIVRGLLIREKILCEKLPPPPVEVPSLEEYTDGDTIRERVEGLTGADACQGCHTLINPLGFAFGHFDAIGRYQELEGEAPIDASGVLALLEDDDVELPFDGARELAEQLAGLDTVHRCFAQQWARYALGREAVEADFAEAYQALRSSEHAKELLVAIATSPAFRFRGASSEDSSVAQDEVEP